MIGYVVLAIVLYLVIQWLLKPDPAPIYHIYSQPGKFYYLKFAFIYTMMRLRQRQTNQAKKKESEAGNSSSEAGYGRSSKRDVGSMECVQQLSDHPKAIDAVYFHGTNQDGVFFVAATARRPHRVVNGFVFLRIPDEGLLVHPKFPDSIMFGTQDEFGAEGLKFIPLEPMRKWRIEYKGQLRREASKELVDVEIDAIWSSTLKHLDFDSDLCWTLARGLAREPWSREYFEILKSAHQTHYEQMGQIDGTVTVAGKQYPFNLDSMRDHSYGHKREWKLLHRYAYHMISLRDGTKINVSIVSQPCTSSVLELGYVYLPDGRLFPVEEINLNLWNIGEKGTPPSDYFFSFKAANRWWDVQVNVIQSPVFYIGWEWEARIIETMCNFQVNGVPGWGGTEFMYRNMTGRPEQYSRTDPEWTRSINKG